MGGVGLTLRPQSLYWEGGSKECWSREWEGKGSKFIKNTSLKMEKSAEAGSGQVRDREEKLVLTFIRNLK